MEGDEVSDVFQVWHGVVSRETYRSCCHRRSEASAIYTNQPIGNFTTHTICNLSAIFLVSSNISAFHSGHTAYRRSIEPIKQDISNRSFSVDLDHDATYLSRVRQSKPSIALLRPSSLSLLLRLLLLPFSHFSSASSPFPKLLLFFPSSHHSIYRSSPASVYDSFRHRYLISWPFGSFLEHGERRGEFTRRYEGDSGL